MIRISHSQELYGDRYLHSMNASDIHWGCSNKPSSKWQRTKLLKYPTTPAAEKIFGSRTRKNMTLTLRHHIQTTHRAGKKQKDRTGQSLLVFCYDRKELKTAPRKKTQMESSDGCGRGESKSNATFEIQYKAKPECFACGVPLIKQHLIEGLPLTHEMKEMLRSATESNNRTLQCQSCGELCYAARRRCPVPPNDGCGICSKCGGAHILKRPKYIISYWQYVKIIQDCGPEIWSCPEHGTKPIDQK